ncbi:MAG: TonB family protein [Mucilaginibacter sp.]|nr:TonB family protein [Mucilaginibacter sp.]
MKNVLLILIAFVFALKTKAQTLQITNFVSQDSLTSNIDVMPEFKGGMDKFYARLNRIPYTFLDRMSECQGRVIVMLIVEKDGSISNLKVLHGFSAEQDEQVLKVFKRLNKWTPGLKDGKPVRVLCSVPINFNIKDS